MYKYRVPIFIAITVGILGSTAILIQIGKGYRPNISTGSIEANGLLSATSEPAGAQIYINGKLESATDDTFSLAPGNYQIQIRKDGYIPWNKTIVIEKELVTQTNAKLFPIAPDLKALTYTGANTPKLSPNGTKILYTVNAPTEASESTATIEFNDNDTEKIGLWVLELSDLPLGFNRDPQQIVKGKPPIGKWSDYQLIWSPDSREIVAVQNTTPEESTRSAQQNSVTESLKPQTAYRIILSETINSYKLVNTASQFTQTMQEWAEETYSKNQRQLSILPDALQSLLATSASEIRFSPDESKILYRATQNINLENQYIPKILAASSQPQARELSAGNLYVYDVKEDKNFLIDDNPIFILSNNTTASNTQSIQFETDTASTATITTNTTPKISIEKYLQSTQKQYSYQWLPTSQHLIKQHDNQVTILEYDNTNHAVVYASSIPVQAFAHPSSNKLILLTTLNPVNLPTPNLYTLILN